MLWANQSVGPLSSSWNSSQQIPLYTDEVWCDMNDFRESPSDLSSWFEWYCFVLSCVFLVVNRWFVMLFGLAFACMWSCFLYIYLQQWSLIRSSILEHCLFNRTKLKGRDFLYMAFTYRYVTPIALILACKIRFVAHLLVSN